MSRCRSVLNALRDLRGVTSMEYGLIAGVIAVGLATAFATIRDKISNAIDAIDF